MINYVICINFYNLEKCIVEINICYNLEKLIRVFYGIFLKNIEVEWIYYINIRLSYVIFMFVVYFIY